jgi:hypothetical protein
VSNKEIALELVRIYAQNTAGSEIILKMEGVLELYFLYLSALEKKDGTSISSVNTLAE